MDHIARSIRRRHLFKALASLAAGLSVVLLQTVCGPATAGTNAAMAVDQSGGHPRLLVLTDIGNEPDDQMSLVRLLVYSNDVDIEGLIAVTSTWQRSTVHADTIRTLVDAYGEVQPNLMLHAAGWPSAAALRGVIRTGPAGYGMAALRPGVLSGGAQRIIEAADRDDHRPLWISIWGGANTLAEALTRVRASRTQAALDQLIDRLRVYAISDQDDAGPWIRREFPALSYIVQPSAPDSGADYAWATWTGISGDQYYRNGDGADFSTVSNAWLDTNIRAKGPFGKHYPRHLFIMEGDTPSFLNLLPNGLEAYRNPSWGGWGGRYVFRQPYGETRPIWTQGGDQFNRITSADTVIGIDGKAHTSDQASIWRWRAAFQNDFAARMDWTFKPYAQANHPPQVQVNGVGGLAPLMLEAKAGQDLVLDASGSRDPDGNQLTYHWFHYGEAVVPPLEPGGYGAAAIRIEADGARAVVHASSACRPMWRDLLPCPATGFAHVILAVSDNGVPSLTSYRRVIIKVDAIQ